MTAENDLGRFFLTRQAINPSELVEAKLFAIPEISVYSRNFYPFGKKKFSYRQKKKKKKNYNNIKIKKKKKNNEKKIKMKLVNDLIHG